MEPLNPPDGFASVLRVYGNIREYIRTDGTLSPRWEAEKIVRVKLPQPLAYSANRDVRITLVTVHRILAHEARAIFGEISDAGLWPALENYGGGFAFRPIRNRPDKLSLHCFAAAFDFDVFDNPLGGADLTKMHPGIVAIFEKWKWLWGGRYRGRKDTMHFQKAVNC